MREKKKILIIDDEENFCGFIKMNLEATRDFEVSICCDGTKAIRQVKREQPDLILLDILMPKVSGPEIAEKLKDDADTQGIPFVFLTAVATEQDVEEKGDIIGGNYVIAKPVRMNKLIHVINEALDSRASHRDGT